MPDDERPESEEELDARLRALIGDEPQPHAEVPGIDEDLDRRLEALRTKAQKARGEFENKRAEENLRLERESEVGRGAGIGLSIAYTIIGMPLLGALIGYGADQGLHTTYWKGF